MLINLVSEFYCLFAYYIELMKFLFLFMRKNQSNYFLIKNYGLKLHLYSNTKIRAILEMFLMFSPTSWPKFMLHPRYNACYVLCFFNMSFILFFIFNEFFIPPLLLLLVPPPDPFCSSLFPINHFLPIYQSLMNVEPFGP